MLPIGGGEYGSKPVFIPGGVVVAYSIYAMHRRPDLFSEDAELCRPKRWDECMPLEVNRINSKLGYLPFNGGPRICLEVVHGLDEVYTLLSMLAISLEQST